MKYVVLISQRADLRREKYAILQVEKAVSIKLPLPP